mgnify:CR=1 FL=1
MSTIGAATLVACLSAILVAGTAQPAGAAPLAERPGWRVIATAKDYPTLLSNLKAAVATEGMAVVTEAGPTEAARARGVEIPGNRVVGVFRNDFAVAALLASTAAMIEAPIRFYVTENPDGTATLSWKTPGHVFAPYAEEGGEALANVARDLDAVFEAIAARATGS